MPSQLVKLLIAASVAFSGVTTASLELDAGDMCLTGCCGFRLNVKSAELSGVDTGLRLQVGSGFIPCCDLNCTTEAPTEDEEPSSPEHEPVLKKAFNKVTQGDLPFVDNTQPMYPKPGTQNPQEVFRRPPPKFPPLPPGLTRPDGYPVLVGNQNNLPCLRNYGCCTGNWDDWPGQAFVTFEIGFSCCRQPC